MRKSIAIFFVLFSYTVSAQLLFPAKWNLEISQEGAKVGDEVDLVFNVKLDDTWYLYSTDFDPNLGPIVTTFTFSKNESYRLIGEVRPINAKKKYDDTWGGEYTYFKEKAQFVQRVKILKENPEIKGKYNYQVCTEVDGRCISFDDTFDFSKKLSQ